jgi:hypothetical protein
MNTVRDINNSSYKRSKNKKQKKENVDKDFGKTTAAATKPKRNNRPLSKGQVTKVIKLIESGMSERGACKEVGIASSSFRSAVARINAHEHYARATSAMAEAQVNKMESVLDDLKQGRITSDMARVELDARKWFASKLLPKKYGDKVEHEQNINVMFSNALPRPKTIDIDPISDINTLKAPDTDK